MSLLEIISSLETIAALITLVAIALAVQRRVWTYPVGLVSVVLYGNIFYQARLYSDALLQGYFFLMQCYGWWHWHRHRDVDGRAIVAALDGRARLLWLAVAMLITIVLGFTMSRYTNAALPWWDATIAGISVVAQILMARRKIEQWPLWIVVNIIAVGVYFARDLYPTTLLYAFQLLLAIIGWYRWQQQRASLA